MRLKKLKIVGFKSFADKVTLDFDREIMGIVGPNGCGKSNIVDAFRWVTGEQSAKSLRGDKMHDVLFAGTDTRKPLGFAEVSVTLTDVGGELPIAYDELVITRRLHRDGESEFLINHNPARLRDIQTLFLGSGIGKNSFSIFEQGKLDQIIHLNPSDRRAIFDEAAGTSRFLQRKKECVRKLLTVTENYNRVHDVHAEVEKQTKQLKKQASHAKSYQENKTRLAQLEKVLLIHKWQICAQRNVSVEEQKAELTQKINAIKSEHDTLENALEATKRELIAEELLAQESGKRLNALQTKTQVLKSEIKQHKQRLFENKRREQMVQKNLKALESENTTKKQQIKTIGVTLQNALLEKQKAHLAFTEHKEAHKLIEIELAALRQTCKKYQAERVELLHQLAKINASLQEKNIHFTNDQKRLFFLNEKEKELQTDFETLEKQKQQQHHKVKTLSAQIDDFKAELIETGKELQELQKVSKKLMQQKQECVQQLTETQARESALNRLKEELEGFSAGAKKILQEVQNKKSPLYQKVTPLFEHLVPKKGFEDVLASSMRLYQATLVVETEKQCEQLLEFARSHNLCDFSVIVKEHLNLRLKTGKKGFLSAHVEASPLALHFTNQIAVEKTADYFDHLGVFFNTRKQDAPHTIFSRESELKSLAETIKELKHNQTQLEKKEQKTLQQLSQLEQKRNKILEVRQKKEMDLVQENFNLQQILVDLEKNKKEKNHLEKEQTDLQRLDETKKQIDQLNEKQVLKTKHIEKLLESLETEESNVHSQEKQVLNSLEQLELLQDIYEKAQSTWQGLDQEHKIFEARQSQSLSHHQSLLEELQQLQADHTTTIDALVSEEKQLEKQSQELEQLELETKEKEKNLVHQKKQREIHEQELNKTRKEFGLFEKKEHGLEIGLAQDLAERTRIEEELLQKHSLEANEIQIQNVVLETSVEEAEKTIQKLNASLEQSGAVNMTAIDEFQEQQQRFEYLDSQLKDLEESRQDLEKIIAKLDQENRKLFKKTFVEIRENFQKNFQILFKGGSADLTFTDNSDILEAGIEIIAKPPGKQMRSISLLSGGEKCLTALALLFSIFEVRPAPYCILDEVDAPLDDRNIDRFTDVLKQFIEKTQFIIVTHNKKTMAIADLLIGVSMEEKGVSKLVSLAFEPSLHQTVSI